jgi:hypothetical protein
MFASTGNLCVYISDVNSHRFKCGSGSGIFGKKRIQFWIRIQGFDDKFVKFHS